MISNGNGHSITTTQRRGEAIDRLLNGRSEAIRANVLSYIVKYKIDPEDEVFIIFVALGTLETLIETSPKEWQELFKGFGDELETWSNSNLKTLTAIEQKASITQELASNSKSLNNSLKALMEVCEGLIKPLQTANTLLISSLSQLQTSETELKNSVDKNSNRFSQLESEVKNLTSAIENQKNSNHPNKKIGDWRDNISVYLLTIILLMTVSFGLNQHRVNQSTSQKVQWLLEKANRMDCKMGIKSPGSPECNGF